MIVLGVLLCIQGILHPFRSRFKNIQESLILLVLLVVYTIASLIKHTINLFSVKLLISISLAYFIIYITCHCILLTCGDVIKQKYEKLIKCLRKTKNQNSAVSVEMASCDMPNNYEEFQEPLIALSNK